MLDIKKIIENKDEYKKLLKLKKIDVLIIDELIELYENKKPKLIEVEELKSKRNLLSKEIGLLMRDSKIDEANTIKEQVSIYGDKINELDLIINKLDEKINYILLTIPNVPDKDTKPGNDDKDNIEIEKQGIVREFKFQPKAHWEIGVDNDIIDFERAAKISGSRFVVTKGFGAKLERALMNYMMDLHTIEHGYTEVSVPVLVNEKSMIGTGQYPKFKDDAFLIANDERDLTLIPTAEVPVTNLHREEIIDGKNLPIYYTAFSQSFRQEAGSAGRDTRGLIRVHQFGKVELVKFVKPENSDEELIKLLNNAKKVLDLLELPYRVVELCGGDLGFSAKKTFDIEVWLPSYNDYKEISSCSNFGDYQARRSQIRFKENKNDKAEFVHTLNGSGVAQGRLMAAVLENYQNEDGTIKIPKVLEKYM